MHFERYFIPFESILLYSLSRKFYLDLSKLSSSMDFDSVFSLLGLTKDYPLHEDYIYSVLEFQEFSISEELKI